MPTPISVLLVQGSLVCIYHFIWLGLVLISAAPHWPLTHAPGCLCMNVWNGLRVVGRLGLLALVPVAPASTQPSHWPCHALVLCCRIWPLAQLVISVLTNYRNNSLVPRPWFLTECSSCSGRGSRCPKD